MSDELLHYGTPRKSGRYPWGSGKKYQEARDFRARVEAYKKLGYSEKDIAEKLGYNTAEYRRKVAINKEIENNYIYSVLPKMKEEGMSNTQIAKELGRTEGTIRKMMKDSVDIEGTTNKQISNIADSLKERIGDDGYLDVGLGTEIEMGISRTKLRNAIAALEEEGYYTHEVRVPQLADPSKKTTILVLTKDPSSKNTYMNSDKIKSVSEWTDDGGLTMQGLKDIQSISSKKVKIRYAEDGGADKDGVIELRKGADGLDLGSSRYAQVRIGVDGTHFLKGMALYGDDIPDGYDIVFNTNKSKNVPKHEVLKKMKDNPDNPFGASITRQNGKLNIVNEEGTWKTWSSSLSAQMLSKQPLPLIKDRLKATMSTVDKDIAELNSLTNPIVKKFLMNKYADKLEGKASHLKVEGLPNSKSHVLLPYPNMKPTEVYAPNYKNGEKVVLIRYPHGGTFEIPELTVNNKTSLTKGIKNAVDAIGIHPSVASKLSGADFDGDTVMVIPNNKGQIKFSRSLKELRNFDPNSYAVGHKTIGERQKQTQMGMVSNLITDMTLKGASQGEIARAVRHSMVVIDSEKHKLDWKQSERDHGIAALQKKYQTRVNPMTGKKGIGASTIISMSKSKVNSKTGKVDRKGDTPILKALGGDASKMSSGTAKEKMYADYMNTLYKKETALRSKANSIPPAKVNPRAKKEYAPEVESLRHKVKTAMSYAPKERQAQILANKTYYKNLNYEMNNEQKKKLRSQALGAARAKTGSSRPKMKLTDREWQAIQSGAVSNKLLEDVLKYGDMDQIQKLATPRTKPKMSSARIARAKSMQSNGYSQAEIAKALGVSVSTILDAIN